MLGAVEAGAGCAGTRGARSLDRSSAHCWGAGYGSQAGETETTNGVFTMAFQVEELSLQLVEALVPLMPRIRQRDKAWEDQLRRAASSIGLNAAEAAFGSWKSPGAAVYGCGQRGGDAACAAPGYRLAACDGGRCGGCDEAGRADFGDALEDDAGVALASPATFVYSD